MDERVKNKKINYCCSSLSTFLWLQSKKGKRREQEANINILLFFFLLYIFLFLMIKITTQKKTIQWSSYHNVGFFSLGFLFCGFVIVLIYKLFSWVMWGIARSIMEKYLYDLYIHVDRIDYYFPYDLM